jgi:hypothetical protein
VIRVSEKKEFNMKSDQRVQCVRLEVLMGVNKIMVSWDVVPCDLMDRYQHFEGTCCPHLQGLKNKIYVLKKDALDLPQTLVPVLL